MAANYRQGVSSLTQPSFIATATDYSTQMAREERFQNELNEAKEEARTAREIARELQDQMKFMQQEQEEARMARKIARELQNQMKLMQQQLATMMEHQRADTSTGKSQLHPYYDEAHDDQPLL